MRKILFRGKRADNGEWVEGYLLEQNTPEYHCYIVISFKAEQDNRHTDILECDIYEVIPETVGQYTGLQYTGLTDKNGKKIFEGDIVKIPLFISCEEPTIAVVTWNRLYANFGLEAKNVKTDFYYYFGDEMKVIGNLHDNPELLNGGAKD